MSAAYKPVGWNRNKLVYDAFLVLGIASYVLAYIRLGPLLSDSAHSIDGSILRMRAFGSLTFILLTIILAIGPLARLDSRFLPLLYNRRHFGVLTAIVAATHAFHVLDWYYNYSPTPKMLALFTSNTAFGQIVGFPFEYFGIFGLIILTLLAVTSHDFWLSFLTPPVWKALHMSVYLAYAAVVLHVALGPAASGENFPITLLLGLSVATLATLHILTGRREVARDVAGSEQNPSDGWLRVGDVSTIAEGRAILGAARDGERIAVFRSKGRIFAMSNTCSHQNGPVGEGKVVLGFVTCPWHGYQYRPEDGCSPPPFNERIRKYRVRLDGSVVWVDPQALPLGTRVEPVVLPESLLTEQEMLLAHKAAKKEARN